MLPFRLQYSTLRTRPQQCLYIWNEYIGAFWPCFQTKANESPNVVAYHARHVLFTQAQYDLLYGLFRTGFLVFSIILFAKGLDSWICTLVRLSIWRGTSYSLINLKVLPSILIFRIGILVFFLIGNKELYIITASSRKGKISISVRPKGLSAGLIYSMFS